jgi:hypothetical protein
MAVSTDLRQAWKNLEETNILASFSAVSVTEKSFFNVGTRSVAIYKVSEIINFKLFFVILDREYMAKFSVS